jgi:hypothetical protein
MEGNKAIWANLRWPHCQDAYDSLLAQAEPPENANANTESSNAVALQAMIVRNHTRRLSSCLPRVRAVSGAIFVVTQRLRICHAAADETLRMVLFASLGWSWTSLWVSAYARKSSASYLRTYNWWFRISMPFAPICSRLCECTGNFRTRRVASRSRSRSKRPRCA